MATNPKGPGTDIRAQMRERSRLQSANVSTPGNPRGPTQQQPQPQQPAPPRHKDAGSTPKNFQSLLEKEFGRVTSGYRSQEEQDELVRRGATKATRSSHTYTNGFDLPIDSAKSADEIVKRMAARGVKITKVIRESGKGKNQGTGAHWHIEIDGPAPKGNQMTNSGPSQGRIQVRESMVPGASGATNTGVRNQSGRIMNSGPAIEAGQRRVESEAIRAGDMLDDLMGQLGATQQTQTEQLTQQVNTVRALNQEMTTATDTLKKKVEPIFKRRQEILDQALEIQSMSPIARAVRGFFDLNYNEGFLLRQSEKLGAIVGQAGDSYKVMQALHADSIEQADMLYKVNTSLPNLSLEHMNQRVKSQEMILQRAESDLGIVMQGAQNEAGLITAQNRAREDILNQIDSPTSLKLLGEAEQNGGVVTFNGVTLSAQQLRENAQRIEQYNTSIEMQQMALANGRADLADKSAARMVEYASESKIDEAIANGGVMDGVQIPPGMLTAEKGRRVDAAIARQQQQEFASTPAQAANEALASANYARTMMARSDSIFGTASIADEGIAYSNQITKLSNQLREATQRGAGEIEIGAIRQQIAAARQGFNKAVQDKVTRLVGNDKVGAGYVQSYLMGDRVTPGAGADMLVHFANKGGLPAALESSVLGQNAMNQVMNIIENVQKERQPNGRTMSREQASAEAARRIANPRTPEGQAFRAATSDLQFQSGFLRLPSLASQAGHEFGKMDATTFRRVATNADSAGIREIAMKYGVSEAALLEVVSTGSAQGVDAELAKKIEATGGAEISSAQQRALVSLIDQTPRISPEMRNSQLMLDALRSPGVGQVITTDESRAEHGGIMDWMTGSVTRGGTGSKFGAYSDGFRAAVSVTDESYARQSLQLAQGYRNDPIRRMGAIAAAVGLNRGEIMKLGGAIAPLLPKGTPQETEAMRASAMLDQGSSAMGNTMTYRSDLAGRQIQAIEDIIMTHKFDDPALEGIRKRAAQNWREASRTADNFMDGLLGR